MTPCLINHNLTPSKQLGLFKHNALTPLTPLYKKEGESAFTLIEMLMAIAFSVLLLTGVYGFYNASSHTYSSGISSQILQDGANIVISKIIEGQWEAASNAVYRLSTSTSYYIPNGNSGILYFCQDSPCSATETTVRWYTLDPTNTSVRYYHPTSNPLGYDTIYTAPAGTILNIRFSPATANASLDVEIDVGLRQNLSNPTQITNSRLSSISGSGAATTFVLLRNHP